MDRQRETVKDTQIGTTRERGRERGLSAMTPDIMAKRDIDRQKETESGLCDFNITRTNWVTFVLWRDKRPLENSKKKIVYISLMGGLIDRWEILNKQ